MMSSSILNFNIGVLGHVDSGKTTLARALSNVASTAAFDKNPQSKERGITLDLGFSSFSVPLPDHLKSSENPYQTLQYTLVDCPGHASLIKTIIGGAQIIDLMMLVIDVTKGIQTQTAECLVIGDITCDHLLVVLNKIDLIPPDKRPTSIQKLTKRINKVLEKTKFTNFPMVAVAAHPGGNPNNTDVSPIGTEELIEMLGKMSYLPQRSSEGPFVFAVDHCFAIKGQGSVMTGTIVQGHVSVSDTIDIPSAKLSKKVKSIQMFKKGVDKAIQGDRVGICVTQFDPKLLERGIVCSPGYMKFVDACIAQVKKITYFKGSCSTKAKFHITIMHDTVLAKCSFFGTLQKSSSDEKKTDRDFDFSTEYTHLKELLGDTEQETVDLDEKIDMQYVLLEFEKPVIISKDAILIGSKLDMDIHVNACRLAFHGKVMKTFTSKQQLTAELPNLKIYKIKNKEGAAERMVNENEIICIGLFKKETKIDFFANLKVSLSTGETGVIMGSFGKSGKIKICIPQGLSAEATELLGTKKDKKLAVPKDIKICLSYKKYIYDEKNIIRQN